MSILRLLFSAITSITETTLTIQLPVSDKPESPAQVSAAEPSTHLSAAKPAPEAPTETTERTEAATPSADSKKDEPVNSVGSNTKGLWWKGWNKKQYVLDRDLLRIIHQHRQFKQLRWVPCTYICIEGFKGSLQSQK